MLTVVSVASVTPATAAEGGSTPGQQSAPAADGTDRYLVRYAPGADAATMVRTLQSHKVSVRRTFSKAVHGAVIKATPAQAAELKRSGQVAEIEPDAPVAASATEQPAPWGLDRIDQASLPLSGSFTTPYSGAGVRAYEVDTGILTSQADFGGRVTGGWSAVADGNGTSDCNGHGTHVAGIMAGAAYGVAKAATLIPVRVLDCTGSGYDSDVIAGLDWVASDHQAGTPAVVNLSLGGPASSMLDAAIAGVVSDGVTAVVAAGNDAVDACTASPARVPAAVTVAATDSSDRQAGFSDFGSCVDLYAPGVAITSDGISSPTSTAVMSGTSMASPHVAGAAALLLGQDPGLTPAEVAAQLVADATTGVVSAATAGTPNRLLRIEAASAPAAAPPAPTSAPQSSPSIAGAADVVAAGSDGVLWDYPATGTGGFLPRTRIGSGWYGLLHGFVADWNQDGVFDLVAQWGDGRITWYPGKAGGGFASAQTIGFAGWAGYTVMIGPWRTADHFPGIVAADPGGTLWFYGNSAGSALSPRVRIGTGWSGLYLTMADFDQDGAQDILARRSDGSLALYRSTGTGAFVSEPRPRIGTGWNGVNSISNASGYQGVGSHGLVARFLDGELAYYPYSAGHWGTRSMIGPGWGSYNIFR